MQGLMASFSMRRTEVEQPELKDRKEAFDQLSAALEAISVKSVFDFRNRSEVPRPVQSVAAASICMVAGIGVEVEVGPDGLPQRSWEAARSYMAKSGPFVNSLRQFPYAVDSGRMADKNVYAARQCLQDISAEHLADEPVALTLYAWIKAAWRYCEVVQLLRLQSSGGRVEQEEASNTSQVQRGTPPRDYGAETGGMMIDAGSDLSYSPPQRQMRTSIGSQPVRTSLGSSVGGATSVFGGKTPTGTPATGSNRSSGAGGATNNKVTTRRPNPQPSGYAPRRSYDSKESSTLRVTPSGTPASGSPVSTRSPASRRTGGGSSPSKPATIPRRTPAVGVGYPRGPRSNVGIEDWRQKLEKMQKEAREMKAMEAQLKWNMKREEDKMRKQINKEDAQDLALWRREQEEDMANTANKRNQENKLIELEESRDYQEFKRHVHNEQKECEIMDNKDQYAETKDISDWNVELKRTVPLQENKDRVDANLERLSELGNYNLEKERQEKLEANFDRDLEENMIMHDQLQKAKQEKDEALRSLDFFRMQQQCGINTEQDIACRPFLPLDQTL